MKVLISILVGLVLFAGFVWIVDKGLTRFERTECLKWQEQKKEFVGWYATEWQKDQCYQFDIDL